MELQKHRLEGSPLGGLTFFGFHISLQDVYILRIVADLIHLMRSVFFWMLPCAAGLACVRLFFPGLMLPFVLLQFWVPKPPSFNPASAIHPEVHPETIAELSPEPPSCEELEAPIELEEEVPTDEACRGNVSRRQEL